MEHKKEIALNKLFNMFMVMGFLCGWMAVDTFGAEEDFWWAVGFGTVAALLLIVPMFFTPYCYLFDRQGVSLCYVFVPTERYLWKNIHAIDVNDISFGKASVFDLFYASVFSISGQVEGEPKFYMEGNIRKSFRTKYLLEKYWDGTITGYLFEDVKKWFNKRRKKKQVQIKAHLTDEVLPLEREARANAKRWLEPFIALARQYDLKLGVQFIYMTEEFEELRSRPNAGYTYVALIEISRPGETNDEHIIQLGADLLYVRLGKTAYRGVVNKDAEDELRTELSDTLENIKNSGIAAYCNNTRC